MKYSTLRYPGGKTRAVKQLSELLPKVSKVIAPFFGGGSFENYLASTGVNVTGFDVYEPLVYYWQAMKNDKARLIEIVKSYHPISKKEFYNLQKTILVETDRTTIGAMYYVLNRSSFNGVGLSGGMAPNHPRFNEKQITELKSFELLIDVEVLCFSESLKNDGFVFADPPYIIKSKLYGTKGSTHKGFDHQKLAKILKGRKDFLLTYNNCEEVKDLYSGCKFQYPNWKYGMSNDKDSKEIVITI